MTRLSRDQLFESNSLGLDLAQKSIGGGVSMFGAQAVMFVIQMVGTVVLARILAPEDYGLIAMAAVVVGFAKMFRDAGLSMATVHLQTISHEQISTLFWINTVVVVTLGVVMSLSAPLVAAFYHREELLAITVVLAGAFVVNGLSIQHDALLKRHMRFATIAAENMLAQAANVSVCILLALLGFGYWALAAGPWVSALVTTGFSFNACRWMPGRPRSGTGVRVMLRFGGDVTGFNLANYFARNADNILIGRYIGTEGLGMYSKAYSLFMMPLTQVRGPMTEVAMPVLSSLRSEPERYRRYYLRLVDAMAVLSVPIAALCVIESEFLIRVLLGDAWLGSVPVFRLLAIVGLVQAVESTRGVVLLSLGMSRKHLKWGVVNALVMMAAFAIGIRWGIVGVAGAYVLASYGVLLPNLWYAFAGTPISVRAFFRAIAPSFLLAGLAGIAAVAAHSVSSEWFTRGLCGTITFALVYATLSSGRPSVRENLRYAMKWVKSP